MDDYAYLIDGKPISARGLIQTARNYDVSYGESGAFATSEAVKILRENGFKVMKPEVRDAE
jgi:hypothetical protein